VVSLARRGCLYHGTIQHEVLHALGFNHEQTRSDRDNHIRVMLQNVQSGNAAVCGSDTSERRAGEDENIQRRDL